MTRLILLCFPLLLTSCAKQYQIPVTTTSKTAKHYYQEGVKLESGLEEDLAYQSYKKAIEEDTSFALGHLGLAMVSKSFAERRQHIAKAMNQLSKVSEGERTWILARNKFYGNGEGQAEIDYFRELVQLYPEDAQANYLFGFANIHHGNNNLNQAIQHYEKAIELNPNFLMAYNELVYAYADNRAFEKAEQIARQQIEMMPGEALPLDTYAEVLMRAGKYEKSIKAYEKVMAINPKFPWTIMGIAANLNFLGRHVEARQFLDKLEAVESWSDYEFRHKWKSRVVSHLDEGDWDGAIKVLGQQNEIGIQKATEHEPFFHAYYSFLRRTWFFFEKGDWKNGLKEYENWRTYVLKASTYKKTHQELKGLQNYYQAYAQYLQGDLAQSKTLLAQYLEGIKTKNDLYRVLLGRILQAEQKFTAALEVVKKIDLNNPYHQFEYAKILEALGNKEADKWYEKIRQTNERNKIELSLVRRLAMEKS